MSKDPTPAARAARVLLSGATGFVGRYLRPALEGAGYQVRCATRRPQEAAQSDPSGEWVHFDLERPETLGPALSGCDSAVFLVHSMGQGREDYPERERAGALAFRAAAEAEGLRRVVYLGGVAPQGKPSKHLQSRIDTGALLRGGALSTLELRAAMVIGEGSSSWQIVSDLARRLPAMLLPAWLRNHSWPLGIDDVVAGILIALQREGAESAWYEIPGPERISHADLLRRVAQLLGKRPMLLSIPVLSPRLSSYWIGLVTRADLSLARELVEGLRSDLDPSGPALWDLAPDYARQSLEDAVQRALADAETPAPPGPERKAGLVALGQRFALGAAR